MGSRGRLAAIALFVAIGSTVGTTVGLGLYYRSDTYRRGIEQRLSDFFGLPLEIRGVAPHSFTARELSQIRMWLPDRRSQIFYCPLAIWDGAGAEGGGAVIHIHDSRLLIGSDEWLKEDYMRVLRASLAHNFQQLDIGDVIFANARIQWMRRDMQLTMEDVDGRVHFADDGTGEARFTSRSFNGLSVQEPTQIVAQLAPREQEFLREVMLTIPTTPLARLGLERMLEAPVTQGSFAGQIIVRPSTQGDVIELKGDARQILLAEFTRRLPGGPVSGQVDLTIDSGRIRSRQVEMLRFSGQVGRLDLNTLARHFGIPPIGGSLHLHLSDGEIVNDRIDRLRASGDWTGGSLDTLTQAVLGRVGVHGRLRITIHSLSVEHGGISKADIDVAATPPPGGRAAIQRDMLRELLSKQLGLTLPAQLLPDELEFVQLGAKLTVEGGILRVRSLAGPAGPAIVTTQVLGVLLPLLPDVDERFELKPLMDRLREPLAQLKGAVRERLHSATGSRPAPAALPTTSRSSRN